MPRFVQVKLLRALQEKEIYRVGGESPISVTTRVIATTKRFLRDLIQQGVFREDLYFRLNVLPIHLPPLRSRREDILVLAQNFLQRFQGRRKLRFAPEILRLFTSYHWPGNVRELENLVERMAALATGPVVDGTHLPGFLRQQLANLADEGESPLNLARELAALEKHYLKWALLVSRGNQVQGAWLLGLSRTTFRSKLQKHGLLPDKQHNDDISS